MIADTIWPLHVISLGDHTRSCIFNERQAEAELEEFDSTDPWDAKELLVLDCLGRRVHLVLDGNHVFQRATLVNIEPNEADLTLIAGAKLVPTRSTWSA